MKKLLTVISIIIISLGIFIIIPPKTPISPHIKTTYPSYKKLLGFKVIGFLPHWNATKYTQPAKETLTDLAYFSLKIQGDGTIQKLTTPQSEEPGWTTYKKLLNNPSDTPLTIVFSQAKNDEISELLNSRSSQNKLISAILNEIENSGASGVNVDIEPTSLNSQSDRDKFTSFISLLQQNIKSQHPSIKISIDVYPTAASKNRIWDLEKLHPLVDYIIMMGYDYHQISSDFAGPNAPLRGSPLETNEDLTKNLSEIIELVPANKVILAIPFYGYEWSTYSSDKYSAAESGQVASLERVQQLVEEKNLAVLWDRNTLTPYIIDESDDEIAQIYFENENSIKLKIDLAKQSGLAGVAFWAIGYEGYNPNLWNTISKEVK